MTFDQFVQRMLTDATFREGIASAPEKTLRAAGVHPTPQMVTALKAVDYGKLSAVATAFGGAADFT